VPQNPLPDTFATKKRFIGSTNRLMGGIMMHQTRAHIGVCQYETSHHIINGLSPQHYKEMQSVCMNRTHHFQHPYGIDPIFLQTSSLYDAATLTGLMEHNLFYDLNNPLEVDNLTRAPYMFNYNEYSKTYPIWIDSNLDENRAQQWVTMLEDAFFLSKETDHLEIQIPLFNAPENTFTMTHLIFDWGPYGGVTLSESTSILNLWTESDFEYSSGIFSNSFRFFVCWTLLGVMIIFDVIGEFRQAYQVARDNDCNPLTYFESIWNILDWMNLFFFIQMIIYKFNMISAIAEFQATAEARYNVYDNLLADARWLKFANQSAINPKLFKHGINGNFSGFDVLCDNMDNFTALVALSQMFSLTCLLCTLTMLVRFLKVLDFQPKLALVSATISKAAMNLLYFFFVFGSMFVGFSVCGFFVFGKSSAYFADIGSAMTTCFNLFLGDTAADEDMNVMVDSTLLLGWKIYYYTYLSLTFFVLLNILLAIIVDAYVEVKDAANNSPGVFTDMNKIITSRQICCTKQNDNNEHLLQTLFDPTRSTLQQKRVNEQNARRTTVVVPKDGEGPIKNSENKTSGSKAIKVLEEVSPGHMVTFHISKEFLLREFLGVDKFNSNGAGTDEEKEKALSATIQAMFDILSSNRKIHNNLDLDVNGAGDCDLDDSFAACEAMAVQKRRRKEVLQYLVEKHNRNEKRTKGGSLRKEGP
jgi:hypothetical protein